jgi:hypothetical protein
LTLGSSSYNVDLAAADEDLLEQTKRAADELRHVRAALGNPSLTDDELSQLRWEYLDMGGEDLSPSGRFAGWLWDRISRRPV